MEPNYSESVINDVYGMHKDQDTKWTPLVFTWTEEQLQSLLEKITVFIETANTYVDFVKFNVSLQRLGRMLDLTGSKATISTIRHFYGLVKTAIDLHHRGCVIHAIEGCNGKYQQIMGDLDLLYSDNGLTYAVDYCNVHSSNIGVFEVHPTYSKIITEKYNHLKSMYHEWTGQVLSYGGLPHLDMTLECNIFKDSPREKDFNCADEIIKWTRKIEIGQAKNLLNLYSYHMRKQQDDTRGMVYSARNLPLEDLYEMIHGNNPAVAHKYIKFRQKVSVNAMDTVLSGTTFEDWEESEVSTKFKLPLFDRACNVSDPFERCRAIVERFYDNGDDPNDLILAISKLSSMDKFDFTILGLQCTITRVYKGDEKFNAVKLTFHNGNLLDLRQKLKNVIGSNKTSMTYEDMENTYKEYDDDWMQEGNSGYDIELTEDYIKTVMHDGSLSHEVRTIMSAQLGLISHTKALSWISQQQEISRALLSVPRKSRSIKINKGNCEGKYIILSIDNVSDRYAVVLTSMGPASFSSCADWSYMILGNSVTPKMCNGTYQGVSKILGCTLAHLDWNSTILSKSISYYTLSTEYYTAQHGLNRMILAERSMPLMLMVQNDNKFAQASEMVRYIFVNGTGLSSKPKLLLDKISWFKPVTFTQKLYMLRMCKMLDVLQAFKTHNLIGNLRVKVKGSVPTKEGGYMDRVAESWDIAMPNEVLASKSDHAIFNSFYICRAMTIQRYNKLVSEALVLEKQLDSRDEYLAVKSQNFQHELRFYKDSANLDDFLDDVLNFDDAESGPWSASWRSQVLSIMATAVKLANDHDDWTIGYTFDKKHNLVEVMRTLTISGVMNSRGSLSTNNKTGVLKTHVELINKKHQTLNQNGKCWKTLLEALQMVIDGRVPPKADYYLLATEVVEEVKINLSEISLANDKLWPLIIWASENHAMCVSKMVHKDQIGSREIAVLNAWSRIMCYYVESLARVIRDTEHSNGVNTNLIERRDKEACITNLLSKASSMKHMGYSVLYDSGDCSKWGPSMMPSNLYLTLGVRMNSKTHLHVLRNCLSLFGTKVFKIPDHFYLKKTSAKMDSNSKVDAVALRLANMDTERGSYVDQYIRLEESMHQGILGCSSSCLGADAHNLSDYVLNKLYKKQNFNSMTFLTSDDYCRLIYWKGHMGMYQIAKETLSIHNSILLSCGIKRNLQKSAMSPNMIEFNSVFHTFSGDFRPDIKQRLSYVDYGHSLDAQPNAEESMTRSLEYLRLDGGYLGSCWIAALNNILLLFQNQSLRLYASIGEGIHHVPLELGGLIKVDPILWCNGTKILAELDNYNHNGSSAEAFSFMMSNQPISASGIQAYIDDDRLTVSSCSRAGILTLNVRPKRATRDIREFLSSQPLSFYQQILQGNAHSDLVSALIACAHREIATETMNGSALRLASCMHVHNQPIFKSNCILYGENLLSRSDLDKIAIKIASGEFPKYLQRTPPFDPALIDKTYKDILINEKSLKIDEIMWLPRKLHNEAIRIQIAPTYFVQESLDQFNDDYNPLYNLNIKPWDFIESKEMLRTRLNKLIKLRYNISLTLMEGDELNTSIMDRIFLSNFYGGCRLKTKGMEYTHLSKTWDNEVQASMLALQECEHNPKGVRARFGSPRYAAMMRNNQVSITDITGLLNMLSGDEDYNFTNQGLKDKVIRILYNSMSKEPNCFSVNTNRLTGNFKAIEYASSRMFHVQQRPLVSKEMNTIGREFIVKRAQSWLHQCVMLLDKMSVPSDTKEDLYTIIDLSKADYISVTASNQYGYFFITTLSGQYIQLITQTLMKPSEIILWVKKNMSDSLDELEALGVYNTTKVSKYQLRESFMEAKGYYPNLQTDIDDVKAEIVAENDDEQDFNLNLDNDLDDIFQLLDTAEPPPVLEDTDMMTTIEEGNNDNVADSIEEYGDLYANLSELRPQSESNVSKPTWYTSNVVTYSQVYDVTGDFKDQVNSDWRDHFYKLELPVTLPNSYFKDDDSGSAYCRLLNAVDQLEESESFWLRDYILSSLSECGAVKIAYRMREARPASAKVDKSVQKVIKWNL